MNSNDKQSQTAPPQLALDSHISPRWLPFIRIIWVACALMLITGFFLGLAPHFQALRVPCLADCTPYAMTLTEANLLTEWGLSLELYAAYMIGSEIYLALVFSIPAIMIFWRKSTDWIGVLASLSILFIGLVVMAEEIRALVRVYPSLYLASEALISVGVLLLMLLFYLFPNGRFAPRWLGYFVAVSSLIILTPPFLPEAGPRSASGNLIVTAVGMSNVVVGFVSQLYRYRRVSSTTQRQQTKWALLGIISMFTMAMYWTAFAEYSTLPAGRPRLLFGLTALPQAVGLGFFPISVVIAMIRYRLWDVDLIVRRTLVYALLTGLLALVYFGSVTLLSSLFTAVSGEQSALTVVIATLGIAALFNPLRHRLQTAVDRRFFRQKYDAQQVLARFAQTARDEVSLEALTAELTRVIQETIQPEQAAIWIKPVKFSNRK